MTAVLGVTAIFVVMAAILLGDVHWFFHRLDRRRWFRLHLRRRRRWRWRRRGRGRFFGDTILLRGRGFRWRRWVCWLGLASLSHVLIDRFCTLRHKTTLGTHDTLFAARNRNASGRRNGFPGSRISTISAESRDIGASGKVPH